LGYAERLGQLGARGDVQLAVGVAEVGLHRPGGDEQRLGDLAVGQPVGGEATDAPLRRCERLRSGQWDASRPRPERAQLLRGPVGECPRAAVKRTIERAVERRARIAAAV